MPASPDVASAAAAAVAELRRLVLRLGDEVATFRRRALQAEARARKLEIRFGAGPVDDATGTPTPPDSVLDAERLALLERENAELRQRLEQATERTRQLLERARFLRQQQEEEPA